MAKHPGDDKVNFETIMHVYQGEKTSGRPLHLSKFFFKGVREYLDTLKNELKNIEERNPTSAKVFMLRDELRRSEQQARSIYDLRQRKVLLLASAKIAGGSGEERNLLPEEKMLLDEIVQCLNLTKEILLEGKNVDDGYCDEIVKKEKVAILEDMAHAREETRSDNKKEETQTAAPTKAVEQKNDVLIDEVKTEQRTEEEQDIPAPKIEATVRSKEKISKSPSKKSTLLIEEENANTEDGFQVIKVLEDLPSFAGPDRNYKLFKNDIISLPRNLAKVLIDRKKAVGFT